MFVRSIRGVAARNAIEYVTWLSPSHSEFHDFFSTPRFHPYLVPLSSLPILLLLVLLLLLLLCMILFVACYPASLVHRGIFSAAFSSSLASYTHACLLACLPIANNFADFRSSTISRRLWNLKFDWSSISLCDNNNQWSFRLFKEQLVLEVYEAVDLLLNCERVGPTGSRTITSDRIQ